MCCSGLSTSSTRSPSTRTPPGPTGGGQQPPSPGAGSPPGAGGGCAAAGRAGGRRPRRRAVDLMSAATAITAELPLYTTNPGDFAGLDHLVTVIPVTGPEVPNER